LVLDEALMLLQMTSAGPVKLRLGLKATWPEAGTTTVVSLSSSAKALPGSILAMRASTLIEVEMFIVFLIFILFLIILSPLTSLL
jgi:hypothetical protein